MPRGEAGEDKCLHQRLLSTQATGSVNLWQLKDVGREARQGWKAERSLRSFIHHVSCHPQESTATDPRHPLRQLMGPFPGCPRAHRMGWQ